MPASRGRSLGSAGRRGREPPAVLHVAEPPATPLAASTPAPAVVLRPVSPSAPDRSRAAWKVVSWTAAGASGACAVAGAVFGWQALAAQRDVESAQTWDGGVLRKDERGRAFGMAAVGLLIAGAATALASAPAYVIARR